MNVGRVSCSSNSTMPTDPSNRSGSRSRASGEAVRGRLDRSLFLPLATLVGPGGLNPLKVPRASVTVFMPPSSPRVLLSILAAASPLEKRGGRCGRAVREKKSGEGGCPLAWNWAALEKLKWSSECRAGFCTRRRLCRGSLAGSWGCGEVGVDLETGVKLLGTGGGRFLPANTGGVLSAPGSPRPPALCGGVVGGRPRLESPRSSRSFGVHEGFGVGSGVEGVEVAEAAEGEWSTSLSLRVPGW